MDILQEIAEKTGIRLALSGPARDHLAQIGYDPAFGARPLKRVMQKEIADPVALKLLKGEIAKDDTVLLDITHDALSFIVDGSGK